MAGGTKRRRKAAPTAAAAAAPKAAKGSNNNKTSKSASAAAATNSNDSNNNNAPPPPPPPCYLLHLFQALRRVASDEECLTHFATSLQDGKALVLQLENASSAMSSSSMSLSETTSMMTATSGSGGGGGGSMDRSSSHSASGGGGTGGSGGGGGGSSTRTMEAAAAAATLQAAATADSSAAAMACTTAGFYMTMANHLIQRLLKIMTSSSPASDDDTANNNAAVRVVLALLSWAMADCLEKCKWERIGAGGASRFWFARVLLWGTAAATRVLAPLDESSSSSSFVAAAPQAAEEDENEEWSPSPPPSLSSLVQWPTLIAATLALERWNPQGSGSSTSSSSTASLQRFWLDLLPALQAQMHSAIIDSNPQYKNASTSFATTTTTTTWLEDACTTVDALLDWTPEEEACWKALLVAVGPQDAPAPTAASATEAPSPSPPAKKRGRRKREQPEEPAAASPAAVVVPLAATSSVSPSATTITAATATVVDTSSPCYIQQLQKQQLSNAFSKLKANFPAHFAQLDGRLAVKRWSALAMDWYLRAVPLLLERARQLLLSQQPNDNDDDDDDRECEHFTLAYKKEKECYLNEEDAMDAAIEAAAAGVDDDDEEEIVISISSPVLAVTLVSRWLRVLVDVNSKSGSRPPTGSMDAYLRRLRAPPPPVPASSRASGKKKASTASASPSSSWMNAKLVRTDVRDLAMAIAHPLLQVHYEQCIDKMPCVSATPALSVWLVNDGDHENSTTAATTLTTTTTTSFYYYPHVAQSLDDLSRVGVNSVMGASYSEQSDYTAHMDHAMAALVFQSRLSSSSSSVVASSAASASATKTQRRGRHAVAVVATQAPQQQQRSQYAVLDARLTRYAMGKLNDAISGVKSDENVDKKEEGLHLDLALPLPVWPMKSTSSSRKTKKADTAAGASAVCTYAGVYAKPSTTSGRAHAAAAAAAAAATGGGSSSTTATSSIARLTSREKVALYLRAMHWADQDDEDDDGVENVQDGEVSTPPPALAPFLSFLLAIVERCYDTRRLETPSVGNSTAASKATTKKAAARPEATGRKRSASKEGPSRRSKRRRKETEAAANSQAAATHESPDHALVGYCQINKTRADLAASVLEAIEQCIQMPATGQALGTVFPSIRSALMTSHIFKFIDLGKVLHSVLIRSRSWEPKKKEERSLLDCFFSTGTPLSFSHEEKKLWERHASVSLSIGRGRKDFDHGTSTDKSPISDRRLDVFKKIASCSRTPDMPVAREEAWPLWLPSMQRLVLSANLSQDMSIQDIAADRFLVDGMLVSLSNALQNPPVLLPSDKLPTTRLCVDEMVPLSLNDTRIFLAAVGRLPVDERASTLMSLLKALDKGLKDIRSDKNMYSLLCQNSEVSSFVARAISLSIHHALLVTFGRGYHVQLIQVLGSTDFGFPPIWLASDPCRAETSFMGILSEWQSSELPEGMTQIPGAMTSAAVTCLHSVLNMALSMGFSSAPSDRCHLLFASWNALGKTALWGSLTHSVQIPSSVPEDLSSLLTVLRNDLCSVHRQVQRDGGIATESSLVRAIDQRTTLVSPRGLSENLTTMVARGAALLEGIITKFVPADDSMEQDIHVEVFALIEALIVYVSFAISSLTKPKSNFFDDLALKLSDKRSRGYSTESEVAASEMDSAGTHDAKTFALERLGEVCDAFGGVPEHPDWLSDCSLRYNVSRSDAREISVVAMEALTKVYAVSERLSRKALGRAIGVAGPSANSENRSLLAQKLFLLAELPCCEEYTDGRDFERDVSTLCEVDPKAEPLLLSSSNEKRARLAARELWGPSTAQRVVGKFQDVLGNLGVLSDLGLAEMRAGGEWEVLISYSLSSASVSSSDKEEMAGSSSKVLDYVRCSEKWENVASTAISSLVPVAALLRFSLYGRGRKAHPLSSIEAVVQKYDSCKHDLIESAPSPSTVPETTKRAIFKTLSVIAQLPAHMEAAAEAVATHLVIEPKSFLDLRGTIAVGHSLDTLSVVVDNFASFSTSAKSAAPFIIDLLAKVLESYNVDGEGKAEWKRLLSFLGASSANVKGLETIVGVNIDSTTAIELFQSNRTGPTGRLLHPVAALILEDSIKLSEGCRRFFGRTLSSIASNEIRISPAKTGLLDVIFKSFAEAPAPCIEKLVRSVGNRSDSDNGSFSGDLCLLLAALLLQGPASGGKLIKLIFTTLEDSILNAKEKSSIPALNLLFLYASSNGKLRDVGSALLGDVGAPGSEIDGPMRLETVQCYISFLQELSSSLDGTSPDSTNATSTLKLPEFAAQRPAACSFITTEGFHEQHWYNCHTCGLTDEKGCCSLCALVCHRGHDVSYARFSSFFCDCGESSAKPTAENRSIASCRCLSPLPHDQLCNAYDFGLSGPSSQKDASATPEQKAPGDISLTASICARIATSSFTGRAQKALKTTLEQGHKSGWLTGLFSSMKHEFLAWKATTSANDLSKSNSMVSYSLLREIVHGERGQEPLQDYQFKKGSGFSVLCSSQRGTFNVQFPSDQRSTLTKKGLTRSIVVADSRGRLVIAESNQLLFFSGLAMINARHHYGCTDFSRSTLPITGSKLLDLNVSGMAISRDHESRIIVWSNDASAVMFLNETASKIVNRIDLVLDTGLADGGKDAILRSGWLSGSDRHPIVLCGHTLRIFDVERPNDPTKPLLSVSVGSATAIRDFAVVPVERRCGVVNNWKIFLLMDSGRLHCVEVSRSDRNEEISVSCSCLGEETLVDLSAYQGTLGEGRHLGFLAQSRVLVYQSSAKGATGFVLREDGTIKSRFQLLPEYLKDVGSSSSGFKNCGFRGPYTHWTELGVVQDCEGPSESDYKFKFSCVATRQDNLEPALLSIELGQTNEICITATPLHPEFSTSSTSVDGFAAFTAPLIQNDSDTSSLSAPRQFSEKVFLCNVMSNGCLGFYTEGEEHKAPDCKPPPGFPLLLFEALKNQSLSESVQYEGEGISSPETRLKLQRDNDSFFLTPKREGYTLTISMKPTLNDRLKETPVIVGLRVLFGKTSTNSIPVKFNVQGRVYATNRGGKAWYPAVLTAGQIALAVRNGYVSLQIGASHSHDSASSSPIIDAIEVYTIDRSVLDPWLPKKLVTISSSDVFREDANILKLPLESPECEGLLSSMKSLAGLCKSFGQKIAEISEKSLLKDIVQSTALGCDQRLKDSIETLMKAFEPENDSFIDDGKVVACMSFLSKCDSALSNLPGTESVDSLVFWHHNTGLLRECLRMASAIARQRPTGYIHALKNNGSALGSIAAPAATHVTSCVSLFLAHDGLVPDFVELCLVEMAVAGGFGSEFSSQSHLGRFATLRCVLNSQNNIVEEQTCTSIERFCQKYRAPKSLGDEFDLFAAGSMVARYKCDSCSAWLKKVRYSLLNDHHPYDLCQECFQEGTEYATQKGFSEKVDVVINGGTVGEDPFGRMTCAEVKLMVPVPVHERAKAMDIDSSESELPLSGGGGEEVFQRQQLYDEFIDKLFNGLLSLILSAVREETQAPNHLIQLAVGLASMSDGQRKLDRKKRLSKELCFCLSSVLKIGDTGKAANAALDRDVVSFLRALSQLVVSDADARRYLTMPHTASDIASYKGTPPFVADAQKVPLKMRKGPAPDDRGFMVCAENKSNVFVWVDQMGENGEWESEFDEPTAVHVWKLMSSRSRTDTVRLHARLCEFLDGRYPKGGTCLSDNGETQSLLSKYTYSKAQVDIADGVLCSRERLLSQTPSDFAGVCSALPPDKAAAEGSLEHWGIEAAMELLTLVAIPEEDSSACWFPLLCRVILAEGRSSRRQLAKISLLRLCGRKHDTYLQVRDHHFFGFHLKKVVDLSSELLEAAAVVKEKARQCGPNWKSSMRTDWSNAKGVEFLGVQDLIPYVPNLANGEAIIKVLGDLVSAAKKRSDNWRRFCLFANPTLGWGERIAASLLRAPPVVTIFALATLLSAESQQKALQLLDLALAPVKEIKKATTGEQENTPPDQLIHLHFVPSGSKSFSSLSDILKLNVDDVHAFINQFVVNGRTVELRLVACSVAMKLCGGSLLDQKSVGILFTRLILQSLREVGELGKNGTEILGLIAEMLKRTLVAAVNIDVSGNAEIIRTHWMQQILALRHDRGNEEYLLCETRSSSSSQKRRYELAFCVHCHDQCHGAPPVAPRSRRSDKGDGRSNTIERSEQENPPTIQASPKTPWLPEQVSGFARGRLDAAREVHTSDAFCSFVTLKYRLAISEIHVEVHDPRGRYVKTITVYATPRPVNDSSVLKSDSYASSWQPIGTLSLARGASRASHTLKKPVLAANLKIEYTEFHERPGGSKGADGCMVVHCPRCTRAVVNNAGVCNNCGEVAFQCRKCRHINYDRLDAFLCVECGYCASGSFSYEITAGMASNAIAITNDAEFVSAQQMLEISSRLYDDLRSALKEQYAALTRDSKKISESERGGFASLAVKRAFAGLLPLGPGEKEDELNLTLETMGKQGAVVRTVARPSGASSSSRSSPKNRAASLLRLSSSSTSNAPRRRSGEMVIRQIGRDLHIDDDDSELLGFLEGSGGLPRAIGLDPSDPLSRLLASVQNRREQRQTTSGREGSSSRAATTTRDAGAATTPNASAKLTSKDHLEICERLHVLLREAERESFRLSARINAWRRLENDSLATVGSDESIALPQFTPSHCGTCAGSLAVHLLVVWVRLFQMDPNSVKITKEMIQVLFNEEGHGPKGLLEWKRAALREIAQKSTTGAPLILEALRLRLMTGDVNAAEILGKILETVKEGPFAQQFLDLATDALETNQTRWAM